MILFIDTILCSSVETKGRHKTQQDYDYVSNKSIIGLITLENEGIKMLWAFCIQFSVILRWEKENMNEKAMKN